MAIAPYRQQVRQQGIDGTMQQAPNAGFGEGIGESISGLGRAGAQYAQAVNQYNERVDEAAAMEQDRLFGDEVRELENGFLQTQGRATMDAAPNAEAQWTQAADRALSRTSGPRQRAALQTLLDRRRTRFQDQLDNHLGRQTEAYVSSEENAHVGILSREVALLPANSPDRVDGYLQLGMALDHISARRGLSAEARQQLGFETFSGLHVATVQSMVDGDPVAAKEYLRQHQDQIDPTLYARLYPQVRDDANNRVAAQWARNEAFNSPDEVDTEEGRVEVTSPVPAGTRISSAMGPRRSPGGVGSSNHQGVDWELPANSPVVAALPGTVSIRNDPDGYGTYVVIDHGGGRETRYAHLSSATVRDGDRVEAGQRIALSGGVPGSSGAGNSQGAHLHFEYRLNGQAQDPTQVIGSEQVVTLRGRDFTTVEDVYDRAEAASGGDWRLREAMIREGTAALSRDRAVRDDREDEARRALDDYLVRNPTATWDQIPSSLKNGVSPSYRLSVQNSRTPSATELAAEQKAAGDTVFNALLDEAAADPETFASRDPDGYAGIVSREQLNTIRSHRRRILTNAPEGARTPDRLISSVSGVVTSYVDQVYGRRLQGRPRTPEQEQQIAAVRDGLYRYAEDFLQRERREPTQAELTGHLRVLLAPTAPRGTSDDPVPAAASFGRNYGFIIPRAQRASITTALQGSLRRAPTEAEISAEYARRLRTGSVDLGSRLY